MSQRKKISRLGSRLEFVTFESDDSIGSDLSFESSDDGDEPVVLDQKSSIERFKEEMSRLLANNVDLRMGGEEEEDGKNLWGSLALNVLKEAKSVQQSPSFESFTRRVNLFRNKVQRSDLISTVLQEERRLLVENSASTKKDELSVHQKAEAKVRQETGVLTYFSKSKREQFELRVEKAEEREIVMQESSKRVPRRKSDRGEEVGQLLPESEFRSEAGRSLASRISGMSKVEARRKMIEVLMNHNRKLFTELRSKQSLLQQGYRYYPEDSKEFMLLYPNTGSRRKCGGALGEEFMEGRKGLEEGSTYLLQKMNRVLNGPLFKHWKSINQQKI